MFNSYYTAIEPFQALRAIGSKPSNTYIGSSQVIDTIFEEVTIEAGEELHDLVGGLFHIDNEGNPHSIRLTHPPHIFEAKYHSGAEKARLEKMLAEDLLAVEDDPVKVTSYRT